MFFNKKKLIGLDIGTSSIKMAEIEYSGTNAKLISFGLIPSPAGSISGGEITEVNSVGSAIQTLYRDIKTNRKSVATALWGTAVIVKKITMPKMDKKLLRDQIRFEAEQYIPFDINNISLDFHVLKHSAAPETSDVLLIAAQNELITQYTTVIENVKLECKVLDVSGFALANCFEMNYGKMSSESVGIFNFGAAVTNFVVISRGEVVFTRDIPIGGSTYTNEIHKAMNLAVSEAEILKLEAVGRKEVPDEVHSVISSTNEMVVEEVRNTLDFLGATSSGVNINRFFYTGGASVTSGLIEALKNALGIPFEAFNPLLRIKVNAKRISPSYQSQISSLSALAIGLGLRKSGDS